MNIESLSRIWQRIRLDRRMQSQIASVEAFLETCPSLPADSPPIFIFNASTRIHRVSLNAAYSLLTAWRLRAMGVPIRHLVCRRGMRQCILGTRPGRPDAPPPCGPCLKMSGRLYPESLVDFIDEDPSVARDLFHTTAGASLEEMMGWSVDDAPLGRLVLPGLRWALRRHHIVDDEATRFLFRQYLASGASLFQRFVERIDATHPKAVVVFNGIFYPEAILRYVAQARGIPVITHEVGLQPFSAFFSHQHATFREIDLTHDRVLSESQQARLDAYLEGRFRGEFSMAGIRFWDRMADFPASLESLIGEFSTVVPVFTNVVFDTSQIHANTLYEEMFSWLGDLLGVIDRHPETLFILRAHPDEHRPGKASQESVTRWASESGAIQRPNVFFISPEDEVSSYELIARAGLVLVYNSSIGLEAAILGKSVLCAGRARYTQADTVFFPSTREAYMARLEGLLGNVPLEAPVQFQVNARRFLYHELFHASLDLSEFLEPDPTLPGMVVFREFDPSRLLNSTALGTIAKGVLDSEPFDVAG